jgi:hypothetical protein
MKTDIFKINLASPPDRELLVAMINVENEQWAEVNQESGNLTVEIYPRQNGQPWVFDLEATLKVLQAAKQRLTGNPNP